MKNGRIDKYSAIAAELREEILSDTLTGRIPSVLELAERYAVTNVTVQKAMKSLREAGLIRSIPGQGSFVTRLKRERTNRIGLSVGSLLSHLGSCLIEGIQQQAKIHGQTLAVDTFGPRGDLQFDGIKNLVTGQDVDGVLLWLHDEKATEIIEYLNEKQMPFVIFPEPDLSRYSQCNTVSNDDSRAAGYVLTHLLATGHQKIAFIHSRDSLDLTYGQNRLKQYQRSLQAAALTPFDPIEANENKPDELAGKLKDFDAVFCVNDTTAAFVVSACLKQGIRVPNDLAITGYDNTPMAEMLNMTSVEQNFEQVGTKALDLLIDEIEGNNTEPVHLTVESELMIRESSK